MCVCYMKIEVKLSRGTKGREREGKRGWRTCLIYYICLYEKCKMSIKELMCLTGKQIKRLNLYNSPKFSYKLSFKVQKLKCKLKV